MITFKVDDTADDKDLSRPIIFHKNKFTNIRGTNIKRRKAKRKMTKI